MESRGVILTELQHQHHHRGVNLSFPLMMHVYFSYEASVHLS